MHATSYIKHMILSILLIYNINFGNFKFLIALKKNIISFALFSIKHTYMTEQFQTIEFSLLLAHCFAVSLFLFYYFFLFAYYLIT